MVRYFAGLIGWLCLFPAIAICADSESLVGVPSESFVSAPETQKVFPFFPFLPWDVYTTPRFSSCLTNNGCGAVLPNVINCNSSSDGSSITYCDPATGNLERCRDSGTSCSCGVIGSCIPPAGLGPSPLKQARLICMDAAQSELSACIGSCHGDPGICLMECKDTACESFGNCVATILGEYDPEGIIPAGVHYEWCNTHILEVN